MCGAIRALTSAAIASAILTGAKLSAPLFTTPCGSSVPVVSSTVLTFVGTISRNSIQFSSSIQREGCSWAGAEAGTRQARHIREN